MCSGLAKAQQRYEVVDGAKRGLASVKWLSVEFFESIGLGKWFKDDREKRKELAKSRKYRAQLKKQKNVKKTDSAEQKMKLRGALNTIKNNTDLGHEADGLLHTVDYDDYNKALSRKAHEIMFDTNLSFNESYELALSRVKRP